MTEWPIRDLAKATGLTSRTLRHYEQIGLLLPSRVASNGYRFYGDAEISRLYRILSLRALDLPLATIHGALDEKTSLADAIETHLGLLEDRRDRTIEQITLVRNTLDAVKEGSSLSIEDVFAGTDQSQFESEVRARWGDEAWERSTVRLAGMTDEQRESDSQRSRDVNAALRAAAEDGEDPRSSRFQRLVADHHQWVAEFWGGREPDREGYTGLSELYVADPRFAANYGGENNAEVVREAMQVWVRANLE
ncbi:MerR family transcriptional regulator [Mycetocola reblochoni]|uniref:Transcriptional regulator, MerR family n=1 Tax=Mycetocola reblochoni REB411 TaxID=1255698 RepID=A0A1R4JNI7_9MICO|nr:MerR family transcriptional regulator [Mycetocola reblochoni]SJN33578.1 transcriptional regulator, MerR family [Mycetocola reblochoni REB411]